MEATEIIIIGAGRHAAETYQFYTRYCTEKKVIGFAEEHTQRRGELFLGLPIWDLTDMAELSKKPKAKFIIAIGASVRRRIVDELKPYQLEYDTLITQQVFMGNDLIVGVGSTLSPGSIFTVNVKIGNHNIINVGCSISHDCQIGDFVTISPRVTLAGKVTVEDDVFIGVGSTIIDGVTIGKGAFIAAGACVVKNVEPFTRIGGVPGKLLKNK